METDMTATDAYLAHETRLGHRFILKDGEWPKAEAGTEGKSNGENKYEAGLKTYDRLQKLSIELVTFRTDSMYFLSNVHVERMRTVQEEVLLKLGHDDDATGCSSHRAALSLSAGLSLNYLMVRVMRHHHWRWRHRRPSL